MFSCQRMNNPLPISEVYKNSNYHYITTNHHKNVKYAYNVELKTQTRALN